MYVSKWTFFIEKYCLDLSLCTNLSENRVPEKALDLMVAKSEFSIVRDLSFLMPLNVKEASSLRSKYANLSLSTISKPLNASGLRWRTPAGRNMNLTCFNPVKA